MLNDVTERNKLQNMNDLRGLFALEIIIGHVVRDEKTFLYPLGKFMICSVAFFFFVSAFGMAYSNKKKEKYTDAKFLINKPLYLFLVAIFIYCFNSVVDLLFAADLGYANRFFDLSNFFNGTNWYIWELIVFYFVFWIVYNFINKYRTVVICVFTVAMSVLLYCLGVKEAWVASSYGFPLGILCGEHYDKFKKFVYSFKGYICTAALAIFGCASLVFTQENMLTIVFMRNAICLAAILIAFYVCEVKFITKNKFSLLLTKYSTELYLAQFIWLYLLACYDWHYMYKMAIVLPVTAVTALCIIHPVLVLIKKILKRG